MLTPTPTAAYKNRTAKLEDLFEPVQDRFSDLTEEQARDAVLVGAGSIRPGTGEIEAMSLWRVRGPDGELEPVQHRSVDPGVSTPPDPVERAFQPGDLLLGNVHPREQRVWLADCAGIRRHNLLAIRAKRAGVNPGYYAVLLRSKRLSQEMHQAEQNSRTQRLKWEDLAKLEVPWPATDFQEAVARRDRQRQAALDQALNQAESVREMIIAASEQAYPAAAEQQE